MELNDQFLMYEKLLDVIRHSRCFIGQTDVGQAYQRAWGLQLSALQKLLGRKGKNKGLLNSTEEQLSELLNVQLDREPTRCHVNVFKHVPELDKDVLTEDDKRSLLERVPQYLEFRKLVDEVWASKRRKHEWLSTPPPAGVLGKGDPTSFPAWQSFQRLESEAEAAYGAFGLSNGTQPGDRLPNGFHPLEHAPLDSARAGAILCAAYCRLDHLLGLHPVCNHFGGRRYPFCLLLLMPQNPHPTVGWNFLNELHESLLWTRFYQGEAYTIYMPRAGLEIDASG